MGETAMNNQNRFLSDAALTNPEHDLLGWERLVDNIVEATRGIPPNESMVIGIKGSWGSGKSTLLNLVRRKLEKEHSEDSILFSYNPWLQPGSEHLPSFFEGLANVVAGDTKKALQRYSRHLSKVYQLVAPIIKATATLTMSGVGKEVIEWLEKLVTSVAGNKKSLHALKDEVGNILLEHGQRIVVFIDDLDRLPPADICTIFQLVKNNGDLYVFRQSGHL